jgi:hypothetical protein
MLNGRKHTLPPPKVEWYNEESKKGYAVALPETPLFGLSAIRHFLLCSETQVLSSTEIPGGCKAWLTPRVCVNELFFLFPPIS